MDRPPQKNGDSEGIAITIPRELELVGERRELKLAGIRVAGRRRRPSGERSRLRRELRRSGKIWLALAAVVVLTWISLFTFPATRDWWTVRDVHLLQRMVDWRTPGRTSMAEAVAALGHPLTRRLLRAGTLIALVAVRRWRHFFAVLLSILVVDISVELMREFIARPRPLVPIIGSWEGPSHPSASVAAFSVTMVAMAYSLVPRGRGRRRVLVAAAMAVIALGLANMYLGTDHPSDVLMSTLYGPAVAVVLFRWFAPEATFPVTWSRGVTAHLDVSGSRGEAIRTAVEEQLGMKVIEMELFGLEGSGGSTPMRLRVEGNPDRWVFAKLYSQTHLRSDRWYKWARTILYGSLEDEVRFASVRRLVEYEDYIQRLMRDSGVPSAEPFGIVEILPEREYLMVSEFLDGAVELTDADVTDDIIDQGLYVVRCLWDAGLAHRDIKPANVMIRDGRLVLIDVAFGTVRPTPWRQAVDLANMMVILAMRSGAERVYERALLQFAEADIAEAFASTRSVTLPSQSRSSLAVLKKEKGIDIVKQFRDLAPEREPISIQRWSGRRIRLTVVAVFGGLILIGTLFDEVRGAGIL